MLAGLSLRIRVFLFFAALALGAMAALTIALMQGYSRLDEAPPLAAFVQVGIIAGFVILGLIVWVWFLFDSNVAKPIDLLSGALRARAHTEVNASLDTAIARYLGDLAPAAAAAAHSLAETRNALAEAIARETARLSQEKARLETLLSDVTVGVLLCSADHQLAFYNSLGLDLLRTSGVAGLDRRVTEYLHAGPLDHAYARLIASGDPDAASDLLCTTRGGVQVLAARMRLVPLVAGEQRPGYVLTLRDVTGELESHARREALMREVFDRFRRPAANLTTLLEVLPENEPIPPAADRAMRQEVAALSAAVAELSQRHEEARNEGGALSQTRASDLIDGLAARLEAEGIATTRKTAPLILRCNGFEVIGLLASVALRLSARDGLRNLDLTLDEDGRDAMIRITWHGPALTLGELERWLAEPLEPGRSQTGAAVLLGHSTEIWPEPAAGGWSLCLPIRAARRELGRPAAVRREVVYDFDLLSKGRGAKVADSRLEDLTYVVFDSETTGLLPDQGDELVQVAAVRIVNGRRLTGEVFDTLVNPGRSIPPSSTEVHGITDAMVADAPPVLDVVRQFHAFAEGAVLVAHNAPFDMQFLRRTEAVTGLRFDHPVLDTVLLSAVVYGQHETHSLDALTHRLGITIPEEARHTAIGDTVATADAFLKLLPMLRGRGLTTFGEVLTEVRKHGRLLKDLN